MDQIHVICLGDPAEPTLRKLKELGPEVNLTIAKTADELGDALAEARALYSWGGSKAELQKVLARAPKLEWIQTRSAGLDSVLFPELIEGPVTLTNGSGTFSQSLGEFVITGALYWAKDLPRMQKAKAERRWEVFDIFELSTQTIGIVGHGDIGRAIARRAKAFGMRVLALRRDIAPRPGDEDVDKVYPNAELHTMLPECDYVVVAAPLTPTTKHLMSTAEFNVMKPSAIIMNVGRGPVIDEAAMAEALRTRRIRGAALDVFEVEPLPADSPIWDLDNVLMSAHTADHTQDWLEDAVVFFMNQFARWKSGEPLKNVVDKKAGY
ncbi:MAG TPA: D-2-hydroxyacid dehydrogenase [Bryobacteraceae bacterium]|nr:D-2-hydroxyacid dehydrogenase [Bryobacteraceae bacterium]